MGHGQSLSISHKQAMACFESNELLTLNRNWKTLASASASKELDRTHYTNAMQGASADFISRLWSVMTSLSSHTSPTYEGFLGAAALASKMDAQSRAQFLFHLQDTDCDGHLSRTEMQQTLREIGFSALRMYDVDILSSNPKKRRKEAEEECGAVAERLTNSAFSALAEGHQHLSFEHYRDFASANPQITEFIAYVFLRFYTVDPPIPSLLRSIQILVPMQRMGDTDLLTDELNLALKDHIPTHLASHALALLYSTRQHGFSLSTLLMRQGRKELTKYFEPPTVLLGRDASGNLFGGYASEFWRRLASNAYGDHSCFVFHMNDGALKVHRSQPNLSKNFMFSDHAGIALGGQPDYHALFLDDAFLEGKSEPTATYGNPRLVPESPFRIQTIEVWGFVDKRKLQRDLEEKEATNQSILANKEANFILDLLGKNYSEGER